MAHIGDDDRREKSTRHREAAFARWENRRERMTRRAVEKTADGLDLAALGVEMIIVGLWRLLTAPFRAAGRVLRSDDRRRRRGRSGRFRRD